MVKKIVVLGDRFVIVVVGVLRAVVAVVVRLDDRADCVVRSWARPHVARLRALVRRAVQANRESAVARYCRADDRRPRGPRPPDDL
ncbi:hypothetical protein ACWGB8_26000 [Kitasatospora sp. NPDC054939]